MAKKSLTKMNLHSIISYHPHLEVTSILKSELDQLRTFDKYHFHFQLLDAAVTLK